MWRIVLVAGLIVSLTACGGADERVRPMSFERGGPASPLPVSLKEPDPDIRRGLHLEYARVDCALARCVALTFDDGPMPESDRLLQMLARYRAKATFFVVGRMVKENPDILRREVAAGHEIANHSWSHSNLAALPVDGVRGEIAKTQDAIREASGYRSLLLRPPYGSTNEHVAAVAKEFGLPEILWAVDPLDWKDRSASLVARRILDHTRPGDIVLMHDIHASTVDAVPEILSTLAGRGYKFVTVSELLAGTGAEPGHQYLRRAAAT